MYVIRNNLLKELYVSSFYKYSKYEQLSEASSRCVLRKFILFYFISNFSSVEQDYDNL